MASYIHGKRVASTKGIIPTGNINITSTSQTNVKLYETAQVVDNNLVPGNIKKDVNILGIIGTLEGGGNVNEFDLLLSGNYNYMTSDVCDNIINGTYKYVS